MKTCYKCKKTKELSEFYKDKTKPKVLKESVRFVLILRTKLGEQTTLKKTTVDG